MSWRARLLRAALVAALIPWAWPSASGGEPSPAYRAALRRTAELRKQRRRGAPDQTVGVIEPFPLPPALIIRHTAKTHGEIRALLDLLRR